MIILYGIANCDSVKKARDWLKAQGLAHEFHDFKKAGVPADRLAVWESELGWEKLLNRKGTTWRKLDPQEQAGAVDAVSAQALMRTQPGLIKRPVVEWGNRSTVGFDPAVWTAER